MMQPLAKLAAGMPHGAYDSADQSRGPLAFGARGSRTSGRIRTETYGFAFLTAVATATSGFFLLHILNEIGAIGHHVFEGQ
jgi:hypothetical protein